MYKLFVNQDYLDINGELVGMDPLDLRLIYNSHREAVHFMEILEQVYGRGKVEIDAVQEYQARMGRY